MTFEKSYEISGHKERTSLPAMSLQSSQKHLPIDITASRITYLCIYKFTYLQIANCLLGHVV